MAAVEVTISGMLYDKLARTTQNVVLVGEASLTGLGVGGGPVIPPTQPPVSPGVPTHPIMLPGMPGWGDPHPEHPIVIPPDKPDLPPDLPPIDGENRPIDWKIAWTPSTGWIVVGIPQFPHPAPSK